MKQWYRNINLITYVRLPRKQPLHTFRIVVFKDFLKVYFLLFGIPLIMSTCQELLKHIFDIFIRWTNEAIPRIAIMIVYKCSHVWAFLCSLKCQKILYVQNSKIFIFRIYWMGTAYLWVCPQCKSHRQC